MKVPRLLVKSMPRFVIDMVRPIACRVLCNIEYSKGYYEEDYHGREYALEDTDAETLMQKFRDTGRRDALHEAIDCIADLPRPGTWLEAGCQTGKSTLWLAERYPSTRFYMFDFADAAIDFLLKHNHMPPGTVIWRCDITDIRKDNQSLDGFFDFASMLDITEHLPKDVYFKAIREVFRVLKPSGRLLLKQGKAILPEHINIRWEWQLVRDFRKAGFVLDRRLPHDFYLMRKP